MQPFCLECMADLVTNDEAGRAFQCSNSECGQRSYGYEIAGIACRVITKQSALYIPPDELEVDGADDD